MAKKLAKKASKKAEAKQPAITFKGDDLEMIAHALEVVAGISSEMVEDKELPLEERGLAAFDAQHCRDILKRMEGEGL